MTVSFYSFLMAVLWFSVFVLIGAYLQRRTGFVFLHRLLPLLLLLTLTIFRLFVPIETHFTHVIRSTVVIPGIQAFFTVTWLQFSGGIMTGAHVLLGIWAAGSVLFMVRLCIALRQDQNTIKKISVVPCPREQQCLSSLLSRKKRSRKVRLNVSPDISTPMLIGLIHPSVLLPLEVQELPDDELQCILNHELTHLLNADIQIKFLLCLLCCVMWWNPCVFLLKKDMDIVLEYKCDLSVTANMEEAEKLLYLQTLLKVLRQLAKTSPSHQGQSLSTCFSGIPEAVVLKQRFRLVVERDKTKSGTLTVAFICVLLALFVFSYSVVFQPAYEPPRSDLANGIIITPQNSYILVSSDGVYYLVYEGEKIAKLPPEDLEDSPNCYLTIRCQEEEKNST